MRAIAIDPGGVVGIACCDGTTLAIPVVPPKTVMTRLEIGGALTRYRRELDDIIVEYRPAWLIVERTIQGARFVEDYAFAAEWIAIEAADMHECRLAQVTATQVRRNWWKPPLRPTDTARMALARAEGFAIADNHAADAALLLRAWQQRQQDVAA